MIARLTLLLIAPLWFVSLGAQDIKPCGTPGVLTPWFKEYVKKPDEFLARDNDTLIYFPLQIHSVGSDGGTGFFAERRILDALCVLNHDYSHSGIQFYLSGEINYISNSAYNSHESVLDGAEMMFDNNMDSVLNIYFVSDPAGTCGYNLPYAGICLNKGCSGPNSHTFAHEVGHAFSVQHPHLGWDGNVYDYSQPTPTTVTYDYTYFKDTLIVDTLIIDTSTVELADGSNCHEAGDFLCDTKADYLSSRWTCEDDTLSTTTQKDPQGVDFRSDASLIMSYALDACSYRFSDEQVQLMHANISTEKSFYKQLTAAPGFIEQSVDLIYPLEQTVHFESIKLDWDSVAFAQKYIVEVSRLTSFGLLAYDTVTEGTSVILPDLPVGFEYYWRVRPYSSFSFCNDFTAESSFTTAIMTNTANEQNDGQFKVYPTLVHPTAYVYLSLPSSWRSHKRVEIQLVDTQGRVVRHYNQAINTIATDGINPGIYFLRVQSQNVIQVQRILVL